MLNDIKFKALDLAVRMSDEGETPEETTARAEAFYHFLIDQQERSSGAPH